MYTAAPEIQRIFDLKPNISLWIRDTRRKPQKRSYQRRSSGYSYKDHEYPDIFESTAKAEKHPCFLCARLRRGWLYKTAQELGCNKIALGHHFDDVIETILMGMLYGSQVQTMMPKLHSENYKGIQLIRPLYLVRENDIIDWTVFNDLEFIQCACRITRSEGSSKRAEIKQLLSQLRKNNPAVDMNIFRSVENVNLQTLISYHRGKDYHHFLDDFDQGLSIKGTNNFK